ncbi:LysR family transcriptional regulator [Psychromonas sp. MME2]|uniref:LysR family transcriptional regulator n=1 Tax=unclassified Psychromonas TaxID=2614957 RepID=UPI00339C3895
MLTRSDDLEILLAVVDCGGFSAAAQTLDMQVARVSRAVTKVEKQLAVSLLNRTTRRVELTEEGRQFIQGIRAALLQIQLAEEEVISGGDSPHGRLRVDAASPFIFHQLIPLVSAFNEAYPNIELALSSNEGYVDLLEKKIDLAIRIGQLSDSTLHARLLGKSSLYIVASPDYLSRRGVPIKVSDLNCHATIAFTAPKSLNNWPLKGFESLKPTFSSSNGETMRQLAIAGNGIACLSGFMVKKDIEAGRLIAILENEKITNTGREQINAVYYHSSSVAKRISAFIDFIKPKLTL